MFLKEDLYESNEKKLNELEIKHASLNREIEDLFTKTGISQEKLSLYINQESQFSPEEWKQLQEQKKKIDQELLNKLLELNDPRKAAKKRQDMANISSWIPVR